MRWEREYEHFRDMGHTWGPGIDDQAEYTEAERLEDQRSFEAYQKKLGEYRVAPRAVYLDAGKALKATLPDHKSIIYGTAPLYWREDYSEAQMDLCRQATESLGYRFLPRHETRWLPNKFAIQVQQYGFLPDVGGNIHHFRAVDVSNLQDCLQLTADFVAIGQHPTVFFDQAFHISCDDTGRLRMELENWSRSNNIPLPQEGDTRSFAQLVHAATHKAEETGHLIEKPVFFDSKDRKDHR